jgi:hypothetical protein
MAMSKSVIKRLDATALKEFRDALNEFKSLMDENSLREAVIESMERALRAYLKYEEAKIKNSLEE